jgi:hypothetical protein
MWIDMLQRPQKPRYVFSCNIKQPFEITGTVYYMIATTNGVITFLGSHATSDEAQIRAIVKERNATSTAEVVFSDLTISLVEGDLKNAIQSKTCK